MGVRVLDVHEHDEDVEKIVELTQPLLDTAPYALLYAGLRQTYMDLTYDSGKEMPPWLHLETLAEMFSCAVLKLAAARKELADGQTAR